MRSVAGRYFLVTDADEIIRLSHARFARLSSNPPQDTLAEFAAQRVRWAAIIVELANRKPSKILRTTGVGARIGQWDLTLVDAIVMFWT
jgi:hypothetical protein